MQEKPLAGNPACRKPADASLLPETLRLAVIDNVIGAAGPFRSSRLVYRVATVE